MFFYLVLIRVKLPATSIAITEFRPDDHVRMIAIGQPAAQEFLGPAIGAGRIDMYLIPSA
jgi:hypothetical protein